MNPSRVILSCGMLLAACATSAVWPWTASLTSSGGIAGRGNGAIIVDSDGTLAVTLTDGAQCEYDASDDALGELIESARPQRWRETYDAQCSDCFEWTLTLTLPTKTYTTSWNDAAEIPRDLSRIAARMREVRQTYAARCGVTSRLHPAPRGSFSGR